MWREKAVEISAHYVDRYEKSENGEWVDYVGDLGVATHFVYDRGIGFGADFPVQTRNTAVFGPFVTNTTPLPPPQPLPSTSPRMPPPTPR
jgi:hypothetical protein